MKTNLIGFKTTYKNRNWGGIWYLDGKCLNNSQARSFVENAIKSGYTTDADVPEDLIRKWIKEVE